MMAIVDKSMKLAALAADLGAFRGFIDVFIPVIRRVSAVTNPSRAGLCDQEIFMPMPPARASAIPQDAHNPALPTIITPEAKNHVPPALS